MKDKQIHFMLDEESYQKLRKQAVEESTTISGLLRTGVDHVTARNDRLVLPKFGPN